MTARTHDVGAIVALLIVTLIYPPENITVATALAAVLANQLGGIAPDIDQPTAPLWRNLPVGRYLGKVFGVLVGGHRFLCHSILGVALFAVLSLLLLEFFSPIMPRVDIDFVWGAFVVGVIAHLVLDSLTKEGVPWLLPLPIKFGFPPFKKLRITTGSRVEKLIVLPGLVVCTIWLTSVNYTMLAQIVQDQFVK